MAKLNFSLGSRKRFPFFILFLLVAWSHTVSVAGQDKVILRGQVVDKRSNEPVIGASVLLKDDRANSGAVSDFDGRFSLNIPSLPATIVVSYLGYRSQEIDIYEVSAEALVVALVEDLNLLNEVVVIGYGTVRKRDLTGAVSSIREERFNKGVSASVDQLLQGTTPGLNIQQSSSEPGGGVSVRIRGNNS
ncbi:MAG: carboxypeptidase-like regulatory domain-containing protein, partial [Tannerella sp.]|nr:carboxypeptidase-like regulatory domain-containing protein [Tannerella sp.]